MSSVKGVTRTILDTKPVVYPSSALIGGAVYQMSDTYEAAGLASGSDITIGKALPKGAVVTDFHIQHDALGSGVTLALGVAGATTRYMAASAAATAGHLDSRTDGAIGGFAVELTAETDIIITTGGASATGTIEARIYYTVPA